MDESGRILVTGATGYIGGRLVPLLVSRGYQVRAMARDPRKLKRRDWPEVEIVKGDVFNQEELQSALSSVDVAYYLIHSMVGAAKDFATRDLQAAAAFAEVAEQAGVRRIIYLGGLGSSSEPLSEHLQSRQDTGQALATTSVPVTELRAAIVVGSGSASFEIIRDLARRLPVMICPRWVQSKCEPIAIRQLLAYLVGVLDEPRSVGEVLEVGGGEILGYGEMLQQCGEVLGRRVRIIPVPVLTPQLSSYWLNLVTSVPMSLARPLVDGLRHDVVCTDFRIRDWIDVPKLTYREAVERAIKKQRAQQLDSRWTDASMGEGREPQRLGSVCFTDRRTTIAVAPVADVFRVLEKLGGENGWLFADWLWQLRATMDWLVGGVGMRRGRPQRGGLAPGDPVDFWRVEDCVANEQLVLRAEMKLPGTAQLAFRVSEASEAGATSLEMTARFWPRGFWGRVYWYAVLPLHNYVFGGMLREVVVRAEAMKHSRAA